MDYENSEHHAMMIRFAVRLATSSARGGRDDIIELLNSAIDALPELIGRDEKSTRSTLAALMAALLMDDLLHHEDAEVRLLVHTCLSEVMRVGVPSSHSSLLGIIFDFILTTCPLFGDVASAYFLGMAKLLKSVSTLKFYVLKPKPGLRLWAHEMVKMFFSFVRDNHPPDLIDSVTSIIICMVEENLEENDSRGPFVSQSLVDVILQNVIKEDKAEASYRLAVQVIENGGLELVRFTRQFLESCIYDRDKVRSTVKEYYHDIILEIFRIAPDKLDLVIPTLCFEIKVFQEVDVRIKALNLLKKLLALDKGNYHNHLWEAYAAIVKMVNVEDSAETRITALSCVKDFKMTDYPSEESQVFFVSCTAAIQKCLSDSDGKVRAEAVEAVCELAKTNPELACDDIMSKLQFLLDDKEVLVRRKSFERMVELYQEYCTRHAEGLTSRNKYMEGIPRQFLRTCSSFEEFRPLRMEPVLADLFPASLSTEERIKHWTFLFSFFTRDDLQRLKNILSQKRRLLDGLQGFLALWNRTEENGSEGAEREMEALVGKMSTGFPDPTIAKDCLQKLYKLKDNGISSALIQLALGRESAPGTETLKGLYLREFGDQTGVSEFFHFLSAKCSSHIFSSMYIPVILDCLADGGGEINHLKEYTVELLLTIIGNIPSHLGDSEKRRFLHLIQEKVIPLSDQLIEILAEVGHHPSIKSDVQSWLKRMCLEGTRAEAKLAVSALADTSGRDYLAELCQTLVDSLRKGQHATTVLQSLSCLARYSVAAFEAQEAVIKNYIVAEIFGQDHDPCSEKFCDGTSKHCSSCELQIFGLKALVKIWLPHKQTSITPLLNRILKMLQDDTRACFRLAAAKSVLRLSRERDIDISSQIFRLTVLMVKDRSPWVRRSFATKLYKSLKKEAVPSRYACAFSFGALDPRKNLHNDEVFKYLKEFSLRFGETPQALENMSMRHENDHPAYVVVSLIHVLAHDADFPSPDSRDINVYAWFLRPLVITLDVLVNGKLVERDAEYASSYLQTIMRSIHLAEDAVDTRMTTRLRLLAKVGILFLMSLNPNSTPAPRTIELPTSFYVSGSAEISEALPLIGGGHDEKFIENLISRLKTDNRMQMGRLKTEFSEH